ncbi:Phosphatidic acid phosphatase type 2/haloperoxidase domain-containing protein [Strongyloides ratti]|uniref:Phosphatidic acid phosphatase type 2/haloperoxidase domain-containing protein n=1 Tax=Strongyloides ratti TaxID=34506 RepID=A0A090L0X2_STRRB|nr:Phosphatidic acid phosphatase type 2/haloperoxidase domain-containing protein [Strongyloides ratti]CEF61742.1 Phosphatidic acid phosphatase type 2/haloperoxidase domain-containing protein [Strongyloides ratti]
MYGISWGKILNCLIFLPIIILLNYLSLLITYSEQGFFCNDDEIYHPFREDTISSKLISRTNKMITVIVVIMGEVFLYYSKKNERNKNILIRNVVFFLLIFYIGDMALEGTGNMAKRIISRLRPNYISVCQPQDMKKICPEKFYSQKYVSNYTCLGSSDPDEHYAFPSGHSSHSSYLAFIITFYLQYRTPNLWGVVKHLIQLLVVALSIFVSLSRVRDFKHRLSDISGGILLGILFGYGTIYLVLGGFKKKVEKLRNYYYLS